MTPYMNTVVLFFSSYKYVALFSTEESIFKYCIRKRGSEWVTQGMCGHTVHSLLLAFITVHIWRDALSIWYVISGWAVSFETLHPSFR